MTQRQTQGTPAGGQFASSGHSEASTDLALALAEAGANLYPNGVCSGCGQGISDQGRCSNEDCGRCGDVVDQDVADAWEAAELEPLSRPLELSRPDDVDVVLDVLEAAIARNDAEPSLMHTVVADLRTRGFDVADPQELLADGAMADLLSDRWPSGTQTYGIINDAVTRTWKGAGFTPSEARRWSRSGITDPALARHLHTGDFSVRPELLCLPHPDGGTLGERVASGDVEWFNAAGEARRLVLEAAVIEDHRVGF
jgi:hypothetical protein